MASLENTSQQPTYGENDFPISPRQYTNKGVSAKVPQVYLLGRDVDESRRLDEQHDVWIKNLGYIVNPRIASKLSPNATVADVGTGTGVWLLDLVHHHPGWELYGFDISAALWHPHDNENGLPNVHFQSADIRQPFPVEYLGKFDLVHVRLLVFALKSDDWKPCIANLKTLLKPGGWIQWEEIDVEPMGAVLRARHDTKTSHLTQALRDLGAASGPAMLDAPRGFRYLRDAFYHNEMKDISEDVVSSERIIELRKRATRVMVGVILSVVKKVIAERSDSTGGSEDLEQLSHEIEKEIEGGAYLQFYIHCMVGHI